MDAIPIAPDQSFLFRSGPPLYLSLGRKGLLAVGEMLAPDQFKRAPIMSVAFKLAQLVLRDTLVQIIGMAGVIGPVGTAQHVGPKGHQMSLVSASLDRGPRLRSD